MYEQKTKETRPEEDLIDVLLDFIIISANLVKRIGGAMRARQYMEGGHGNVDNQRNENPDYRPERRSGSNYRSR